MLLAWKQGLIIQIIDVCVFVVGQQLGTSTVSFSLFCRLSSEFFYFIRVVYGLNSAVFYLMFYFEIERMAFKRFKFKVTVDSGFSSRKALVFRF